MPRTNFVIAVGQIEESERCLLSGAVGFERLEFRIDAPHRDPQLPTMPLGGRFMVSRREGSRHQTVFDHGAAEDTLDEGGARFHARHKDLQSWRYRHGDLDARTRPRGSDAGVGVPGPAAGVRRAAATAGLKSHLGPDASNAEDAVDDRGAGRCAAAKEVTLTVQAVVPKHMVGGVYKATNALFFMADGSQRQVAQPDPNGDYLRHIADDPPAAFDTPVIQDLD